MIMQRWSIQTGLLRGAATLFLLLSSVVLAASCNRGREAEDVFATGRRHAPSEPDEKRNASHAATCAAS
jgi:hypothetical protein